jgi:hypothetical protein
MAVEVSVDTIFQYHQQTIMISLACAMLSFSSILLAKIVTLGGNSMMKIHSEYFGFSLAFLFL